MPPRTINPQFSQWMQDFFSKEGSLPSLYQGMPIHGQTGYDLTPMEFMKEWGVEHLPPAGIISDYPGFKEKYEVLDYMIGGEKIREGVESERYKLQDLLESVQTTGPEGLRVGGVSRELENQRETINQGLADLEAKKAFGLKAQETELAQGLYDLRAGYEEQASGDYLRWLRDYMPPEDVVCGEGEQLIAGQCVPMGGPPPTNPVVGDTWVDAYGDMHEFDGANWVMGTYDPAGEIEDIVEEFEELPSPEDCPVGCTWTYGQCTNILTGQPC